MTDLVAEGLALWGLQDADCSFVAGRENRVYRVTSGGATYALRIKRLGYRDETELNSELAWLKEMGRAGLNVPSPLASRSGRFLERLGDGFADVVGWLSGAPMGKSRVPLDLPDRTGVFRALGEEIAKLHTACDAWTPPDGFRRCAWDIEGLLGEAPVWDRFWDNPMLDSAAKELFLSFRQVAREHLAKAKLDYGLIHADLVRENVLLDGPVIRMIDFDDGGFGFRQFDLATVLLKSLAEPDYPALRAALVDGYLSRRALDLATLDLFIAIRSATYVGWIITRLAEEGGVGRNARFVSEAQALCGAYLRDTKARKIHIN